MDKTTATLHAKIGNGYGGFEHLPGETACGLAGKGRRFEKTDSYFGTTCPDCQKVVREYFGSDVPFVTNLPGFES